MVRFFDERFFAFSEIADLQERVDAERRPRTLQDMHVHSTFSDGANSIEQNIAEAESGSGCAS